ncbi:hypothetical protein MPC1_12230002 [Methylocella tundrae]|nr:hypothetical protein MPC1_12230002 [Methylocella tundrae]
MNFVGGEERGHADRQGACKAGGQGARGCLLEHAIVLRAGRDTKNRHGAPRHGRIVSCAWRRKMHGQAGLTRRHRNLISEMCVERHFRVAAKVVWSGGGRAAAKSGGAFCVDLASEAAPLLAKGVSVVARNAVRGQSVYRRNSVKLQL